MVWDCTAKIPYRGFCACCGRMLTDAVDAIAGCSFYQEYHRGFGVLAIIILCALPVIKILSAAVMYRLAAALLNHWVHSS